MNAAANRPTKQFRSRAFLWRGWRNSQAPVGRVWANLLRLVGTTQSRSEQGRLEQNDVARIVGFVLGIPS